MGPQTPGARSARWAYAPLSFEMPKHLITRSAAVRSHR